METKGSVAKPPELGILIQARMDSSRLPGKVLKPFSGSKSILQLILEALQLDFPDIKMVVCTSTLPNDDAVAKMATSMGVSVFRGASEDVLDRLLGAAKEYGFEYVVRICADNPFLQTDYLKNLIEALSDEPEVDYLSYATSEEIPVIKTHYGLFAEVVSVEALSKVAQRTDEPVFREHVTNYLYTYQEGFKLRFLELPELLAQRPYLRFTLDDPDDFSLLQELYEKYSELNFNLERLIAHIDNAPQIQESMTDQVSKYTK